MIPLYRSLVVYWLFSSLIMIATAALAQSKAGSSSAPPQSSSTFAPDKMETVLYGVAYYPEYMPYERLDKDVELMQKARITVEKSQ